MTSQRLRLLYLGNAFPPGVSGRFPSLNPAGHAVGTRLGQVLARFADVSTVGLMPGEAEGRVEPTDESIGLAHELFLWEKDPRFWHDWRSWRMLRHYYCEKVAREGVPDVLLTWNLPPVYSRFVRWLQSHNPRPLTVLIFADSSRLGQKIKWSKRLRHAFKPMQIREDVAIRWYDACISFGVGTQKYFEPLGIPWMWMPASFSFQYDPPPPNPGMSGPITFGYFGALAEHASVIPLAREFLAAQVAGNMHMCGYGKQAEELTNIAAKNPNLRFDGTLPRQTDCLAWAQKVDVLVNPRLSIWGLDNSFPSKIFEYGMTGKAILTTRTGGVDRVLGEHGIYLDANDFENSLRHRLREVSAMSRTELQQRGAAIRNRLLKDFNWDAQGARMMEFMKEALQRRALK